MPRSVLLPEVPPLPVSQWIAAPEAVSIDTGEKKPWIGSEGRNLLPSIVRCATGWGRFDSRVADAQFRQRVVHGLYSPPNPMKVKASEGADAFVRPATLSESEGERAPR